MTVGVGDDVAYAATPEQARPEMGWHARFITAFGGGVVVVVFLLLGSLWSDGLRASTFEDLRGDLRDGSVQEWYVADALERGNFHRLEARQSTFQSEEVTSDGTTVSNSTSLNGPGELTGGILVWRAWGQSGWQVATADAGLGSFDGYTADATPETQELVKQLRAAGVSMRPHDFGNITILNAVATVGAFGVFAGLVMGAAPRVGTRWFWFWMFLNGPLFLGFVAYAVMELIGFRRRPDPPLKKRLPGIASFVGAFVLGVIFSMAAEHLRSRGVPLPL